MLSTYSVPAVLGSSLIWMIALLSGTVYSAMSMSMEFQLPGVTVRVK